MCGILGILSPLPVAGELVLGLTAQQHRGQDAAGIVTLSDRFHMKKGAGLVAQVFHSAADIEPLQGRLGLGHVRYATQGTTDVFDAQPFAVNYPFGLAMVHNGNVTNFAQLREQLNCDHHRLVETTNDVELILYTLAAELEKRDLKRVDADSLLQSVAAIHRQVEGAYSVVALIAGKGLLAFRDPAGIRPLIVGKRETADGTAWAFASESTAFDCLGFELLRELAPGEAMFVSLDGQLKSLKTEPRRGCFCAFEFIYFAREDARMNGSLVARERVRAGRQLAARVREAGLHPDIVIDVPSSAYFAASGLAEELGVPYRRGLTKNAHIGRSFIVPTQIERERLVRQKLNPIREVVAGKRVAVVDDSIVRGTTSRHIVRLLREAGAAEVYFVSAAPPVKFPCVYGIDMATKREIIAADQDLEQIRLQLGADAVVYQNLVEVQELYADVAGCFACFSGEYPTKVDAETLARIEAERDQRRGTPVPYGALAGGR